MDEKEKEHLQQEQETEPRKEPIGITMSRAQQDITLAIIQIQNTYGLPAYLMDILVTAALADIRACANKDLLNNMSMEQEGA